MKHLGTVYLGDRELEKAEEFYALSRQRYQQLELELSPGYCDLMVNLGRSQARLLCKPFRNSGNV